MSSRRFCSVSTGAATIKAVISFGGPVEHGVDFSVCCHKRPAGVLPE